MTDIINKGSKSSGVPSDGMHWLKDIQQSLVTKLDRTTKEKEPIVYEFTQDRALLHQYYRLRDLMYRKVHHLTDFDGSEDVYDKMSHILIARRGKLCIGGCRLIVRDGDENFRLPLETKDFTLYKVFPGLPLKTLPHGEVSRLAVLDEDEERLGVMRNLIVLMVEKGIELGLGFIFHKAPPVVARSHRKIVHNYCPTVTPRICMEIDVPENPDYPEIKWLVTQVILPAGKALLTDDKQEAGNQDLLLMPTNPLVH